MPDPAIDTAQTGFIRPVTPEETERQQIIDRLGGPFGFRSNALPPAPAPFRPVRPPSGPELSPVSPSVQPPQAQPQPDQQWRPPYRPVGPRGYGNWGQSWWPTSAATSYPGNDVGGLLPSPMESVGLIQSSGNMLSQYGSPGVAQFARAASGNANLLRLGLDILSKGAFSKNQMQSRLMQLRIHEEEMLINSAAAVQQLKKELTGFSRIYSAFNLKQGGISAEDAHRQVEELAMQTGDQNLINVLNNGGLGAAEKYLNSMDAKMRDLEAAYESTSRSSKTGGVDPFSETATDKEERPDPLAPPAPPETKGPGAAEPTAETPLGGSMDDQLKSGLHLNDAGVQAVHDVLRGGDLPKGYRSSAAIDHGSRQLERVIEGIAGGQGTPEEKIDKIKQIDRQFGEQLEGVRHGEIDPKATEHKRIGMMLRLSHAIDPGFQESNYAAVAKFNNPDTQERRTLRRAAGGLPTAITGVFNALQPMSETQKIPLNWVAEGESLYFSGDPKYANLYQALNNWAQETISVETATGTPRVMLVKMLASHLHAHMSPAQLRAQIQTDSRTAWGVAQQFDKEWQQVSRRNTHVPGWSEPAAEVMDGLNRMNPYTGVMPSDAPRQLLAYSKPGTAKPSWLRPEDAWRPLTKPEVSQAKMFLDRERDNPDPKVQQQLQILRRRLGPVVE